MRSSLTVALLLGAAAAVPASQENPYDRALVLEASGDLAGAVAEYDRLAALRPRDWRVVMGRGSVHFKTGNITASLADFDRTVELAPAQEPYFWQRGIAQYYAGRYQQCARQFELHRTVNPADVENAAWHFLCRARSASFEQARRDLLPVGSDTRAPMASIYDLFAGRATPEAVLAAAARIDPASQRGRSAAFYAHLYVGLFYEAAGREELAFEHLERAVELEVPGTMSDVARVHVSLRRR